MKFHPDSSPNMADLGWAQIELLPGRPYCVRHTQPRHTVGIAIERQRGVHAFGSDRLRDYDTWTGTLAYTPPGIETYSESDTGGEYLVLRFSRASQLGWQTPGRRRELRPSFAGQREVLEVALQLRRALVAPWVEPGAVEALSARMILLAQTVLECPDIRAGVDPQDRSRIVRVLDRIEAGIAEPLRLPELAVIAELPLLRFLPLTPMSWSAGCSMRDASWVSGRCHWRKLRLPVGSPISLTWASP